VLVLVKKVAADDFDEIKRMQDLSVDGIISNYPDRIKMP